LCVAIANEDYDFPDSVNGTVFTVGFRTSDYRLCGDIFIEDDLLYENEETFLVRTYIQIRGVWISLTISRVIIQNYDGKCQQ